MGEVPAVLQVVAEPSGPVVLHVEQVGLVHCVDRQGRRHAAALVAALSMATQVSECTSARCPSRLVVEVIVVRDLRRVLPIRQAGPL